MRAWNQRLAVQDDSSVSQAIEATIGILLAAPWEPPAS